MRIESRLGYCGRCGLPAPMGICIGAAGMTILGAALGLLILAWLPACTSDGKPRPVTPEDVEAARQIACAADPRLCLPEATATPTPAPPARPTAEPSPTAQATATPPSGLDTPTPAPATPTPTPTASPTPAPSVPPPTATPWPAGYFCAIRDENGEPKAPWLWPTPPPRPVPVLSTSPCKPGFGGVGADRNDRQGCSIEWPKRAGEKGRTPAEGTHSSLIHNHVIIDPVDGMVRDVDNGKAIGEDRWARHVIDGQFVDFVDRPWWDGEYAQPEWCAVDPTAPTPAPPTPAPLPTPPGPTGTVHPPTLGRWKVQNVDNHPNTVEKFGCHNPKDAPKFLNNHVCEVGSTQAPFHANADTPPGPDGPCDTDHMPSFMTICSNRDWDDPRGPVWTIKNAEDLGPAEDRDGHPNNHHRLVRFEPGRCFEICTEPRPDLKSADGIPIPFDSGAKTCAEHCY